jgi:peroxiredoxin
MIRLASVSLVVALIAYGSTQGGSSKVSIGDACPDFKLPGVDGKTHTLAEYKKDVLVIIITCNHCPVAVAYEDRIIKFTKEFGSKADIVAINVNNNENDRMPRMIERAKEKGFNFPYLYDESQGIARALQAKVTPHFYVFNKERKLVYQGAMDDNNNETTAKVSYLAQAVNAAADGKTAPASTKARGCGVQYETKK